VPSALVY